jgi:phage terminase small subunit
MTPLTSHRRAPNELGETGKSVWRDLTRTHDYDAGQLRVLYLLAQTIDRQTALRQTLEQEGLIYETPSGQIKQRPEVALEAAAVERITKLYAQLGGAETVAQHPMTLGEQLTARRAGTHA